MTALPTAIWLLFTLLFCAKSSLMLQDTDFWWHLKAGDLIRANLAIPTTDIFSFTANNYPWLNISWLWDVAYSWLNHLAPLYLPLVTTAIINAGTLALLAAFMQKRGAGALTVLVTILLCSLPFSYMLTPRPHQVTFLMALIFYITAHNAKPRQLALLPLLMIIWVNTHGGFLVGFIILGVYFLFKRNLSFALTLAACLAAACINPLGTGIFEACARTLTSALLPIISEWQPLAFGGAHITHAFYIFIFLITFKPFNPKTTWPEKILSLFWLAEALQHERNLPIFALLSAPILALNIEARNWRWLAAKNAEYNKDLSHPRVKTATLTAILITILLLLAGAGQGILNTKIPPLHPVEEAEYINKNHLGRRWLNDYFQGGYLLYAINGKIFIDGRAETAYPPEVVADYLKFHRQQAGWETMLGKYDIDAAIIPRESTANNYFKSSKNWRQTYKGRLDNIYIRN